MTLQFNKERLAVQDKVYCAKVSNFTSFKSGKAIANLEYEKVSHDAPVFIGDTLYAETEVLNKRESRTKLVISQ